MIDLKKLQQNPAEFKEALKKKNVKPESIDEIMSLDEKYRAHLFELELVKAEQNKISKEIATATPESRPPLLEKSKVLKEKLKNLEPSLEEVKSELQEKVLLIPNPPLPSVPAGKDDSENQIIRTVGTKPTFNFEPKDHQTKTKKLNLIEMDAAAKASGSRFYYLKNDAVLLEFALVQFTMEKLMKNGFSPVIPPVLVKEQAMVATGFFPADKNEIYSVNPGEDNLFLVGTAEVPLSMLHADQILEIEQLPIRYAGFSTCFRREAGTYGKDTHGIFRVHQFDKVEMFSFCLPDKSEQEHELILKLEEEILSELGLHYNVMLICGGDLGAPAAKKYDLEAWIPSQQKYRELTSCSNYLDYTARRSNIRYKNIDQNSLIHTLNGTSIAISRTLIAIFENHQNADGSITIPEPLRKYMGNREKIC